MWGDAMMQTGLAPSQNKRIVIHYPVPMTLPHSASYDAEGNIILSATDGYMSSAAPFHGCEAVSSEPRRAPRAIMVEGWRMIQGHARDLMKGTLDESKNQYAESLRETRSTAGELGSMFRALGRKTWGFLAQPVWIPARKSGIRQTSRGVLFLIDTVRFGGTFAGIFLVLFVGMNYQSFWEITKSRLSPLGETRALQGLTDADRLLTEKLKGIPSLATAGRNSQSLLRYLPQVGPPQDLLIIPKLHIEAPIVLPSYAAMLKEDWAQVETDIQDALEHGVVHYPGTARPGQGGNFFITGHSSYYPWARGRYKTIFARLHDLDVGDEYWVYYRGDKHRYIVRSKREVQPSDTSVLDQPTTERIATLMTCTPIGTTLRRLILVAEEVDSATGIALKVGEKTKQHVADVPLPEALPI